jgi:hypothetical protein
MVMHGVEDLDAWCEKYDLKPFETDCRKCHRKFIVNIPFRTKARAGLCAFMCECGDYNTPFQVVIPVDSFGTETMLSGKPIPPPYVVPHEKRCWAMCCSDSNRGKPCGNTAGYNVSGKNLCGVHYNMVVRDGEISFFKYQKALKRGQLGPYKPPYMRDQ